MGTILFIMVMKILMQFAMSTFQSLQMRTGKLVIGTPVGYFEENGKHGGGILVPLDELGFLNETRKNLLYYKDNPKEYKEKCEEIQHYAREHYDWGKTIHSWVELFS